MDSSIRVRLVPVINNVDIPTVIKTATLPNDKSSSLFVATQPGIIWVKNKEQVMIFLDIRNQIGFLGSSVPALPSLGFPKPETYDERGLVGLEFHPSFSRNGIFYVFYSNVRQRNTKIRSGCTDLDDPKCILPYFFEWQVSTRQGWSEDYWDHIDHLEEWQVTPCGQKYVRTIISFKRPFFNHVGFNTLKWSPELNTLTVHLGDGGSEYDPLNIAQDDNQLNGKLIWIDLERLKGASLTQAVTSFSDLNTKYPEYKEAFKILVKGLRNPNALSYERTSNGDYIKYLSVTGQDTVEFIYGFRDFGINTGFRPWEGIFPTSIKVSGDHHEKESSNREIMYPVEALHLPNYYHSFVNYSHLNPNLNPHANTGSTVYKGDIPGLKNKIVYTDWMSHPSKNGLLLYSSIDRDHLQKGQPTHKIHITNDLGNGTHQFTALGTNNDHTRLFVGIFASGQVVLAQSTPLNIVANHGTVYEVIAA